MIKLGEYTLNKQFAVTSFRKKLYALLTDMGCSNMQKAKITGINSDIGRVQCLHAQGVQITIFLDLQQIESKLIFEYNSELNVCDYSNLSNFFKNINSKQIAEDDFIVSAEYFVNIDTTIFTESFTKQIIAKFNEPTKEELFYLIKNKNNELQLQAKELKETAKEAEAANYAKSEFLANMSHEIRTPMNAVLGFTDILKGMESDVKKIHYINTIKSSGQALLNLINDILDLSKIESGKLELNYAACSIPSLCSEINTVFSQKISDKGLAFSCEVDENMPHSLLIDEMRIRQVFINLLSNAIKFTHKGHIKFTAQVETNENPAKANLIFKVIDTGIGIPKDQINKVFGAFEQVKGQNEKLYGGTGLGLAITYRIVQLMGGAIGIESEEKVGTTFTLSVPNVELASEAAASKEEENIDSANIKFEKASILIADDVDYNREILTTYLSEWDFEIYQAVNGREEVDIALEKLPDLILTDIKMPEMDGIEATDILKNNAKTAKIPIVAVTASALKQEEEELREVCDGYLTKPVAKNQLVNELMKFIPYELVEEKGKHENEKTKQVEQMELIPPPMAELEKLYHLAMRGVLDEISEFAKQLKDLDSKLIPFANKIEKYVENLDDEEILNLAEEYLE